MPLSPAQRHRLRVLTEKEERRAAAESEFGATRGEAFELNMAQLYEFKKRLKDVQSTEGKAVLKRSMLPELDPYINTVLATDGGQPNEVLMTALVWNIDAGNYLRAIELADYALRHNLPLPDQYKRNLPTLLQDEISEAILLGTLKGDDAMQVAGTVLQMTEQLDSHDQAKAKLYKAGAYALLGRTSQPSEYHKTVPIAVAQQALPLLRRAMELFAGIGVKKDIERLESRINGKKPDAPQAS